MIQKWFEQNYIIYALLGICGIGVLIKLITNFVYIRLVKASGNIGASKNKLIQQMKLKFETFYKLKIGVNNVDIFVDKYVYKYKICGLLLSTWENISGLMLILCLLIAPIASILGLILKCGENAILYTFFTGVCTSAVLILVDNLFNISSKRQMIKLNLKDYLENYLKARLEQEATDPEAFAQYRAEMAANKEAKMSPSKLRKEEKRREKERKEHEKFLEIEAKQKERQQRKQDKIDKRQAEIERKEEEKRQQEENRRLLAEAKAEEKRKAVEAKKEREAQKQLAKQQEAEKARMSQEEKAAKKREENMQKQLQKELAETKEKEQQEEKKHVANLQALKMMQEVEREAEKEVEEMAVAKDSKKNLTEKQIKIQQRNERLKAEIQEQREQRAKDRMEGKDPFETYAGTKTVASPKEYKVDDFDMEYEMRVKAVQREENRLREKSREEQALREQKAGQAAATLVMEEKKAVQLHGNNPTEDKVIDDILKQFLA